MIDRNYSQNLNINFDVSKLRYVNIKTLTRFVVIFFIIIKFSDLFRKTYIYISSNFEICAHKNVIQKNRYHQFFINYFQNSHQDYYIYAF